MMLALRTTTMTTRAVPQLFVMTVIARHQGTAKRAGAAIDDGMECLTLMGGDFMAVLFHQRGHTGNDQVCSLASSCP